MDESECIISAATVEPRARVRPTGTVDESPSCSWLSLQQQRSDLNS